MTYVLRKMQQDAVDRCIDFFQNGKPGKNGIAVCPTAWGKSLLIANTVAALDAPALVFQPSKEILEQNLLKFRSYGFRPAVYSASMGRKTVGDITLATIGSVAGTKKKDGTISRASKAHLFQDFPYVFVDECDTTNAKGGQYKNFFDELDGVKIVGCSATPWRMSHDSFGSMAKFLTRTRPRIFDSVIHYTQVQEMVENGYWAKLEYHKMFSGFDRHSVKVNSSGTDYDERALFLFQQKIGFQDTVADVVQRLKKHGRRNCLVFVRFVKEAEYIASKVPGLVVVTSDTPPAERAAIGKEFRAGRIWGIINCGVYLVGFDYPELETIVLARLTKSLRIAYQSMGRGVRIHPDKESCYIVDMVGLTDEFGKLEDLKLYCEGESKWAMFGRPGGEEERQLTNVPIGESGSNRCPRCGQVILFWARHIRGLGSGGAPMQKPANGYRSNIAIRAIEGKTFYEVVGPDSPEATHVNHFAVCGKHN